MVVEEYKINISNGIGTIAVNANTVLLELQKLREKDESLKRIFKEDDIKLYDSIIKEDIIAILFDAKYREENNIELEKIQKHLCYETGVLGNKYIGDLMYRIKSDAKITDKKYFSIQRYGDSERIIHFMSEYDNAVYADKIKTLN